MLDPRFIPKRGYTDEDYGKFLELTASGAVAIFLYCNKVLANGENHPLCADTPLARTVGRQGVIMAPVSFFADFLGCEVKSEGKGYRINRADLSVYVEAERDCDFSVMPKFTEGRLYVPAAEVAKSLGLATRVCFFDRLLVIGEESCICCLDGNAALAEAGAFAVFGKRNDKGVTAADYSAAKEKYRLSLVGSPEINDMSDPAIREKVEAISERCKIEWETMNKGEGINLLWGDHKPELSEELSIQYNRISILAHGWGTYGSEFYHNEKLLADILFAIEWMYENMYGEKEMRNEGWRDIYAFNWWYWHSGAINPLTDALIILGDIVPLEDRRRLTKCYDVFKKLMPQYRPSSRIMTKVGLLNEQPEKFSATAYLVEGGLLLSDEGQGKHTDYLDFTHGFPHNISYGALLLTNHLTAVSAVAGTALDYAGPYQYNLFELFKYMYEPAIYNGRGYIMFSGRQNHASEKGTSYGAPPIIANLLGLIGVFGEEEDYYLKCFIKRQVKSDAKVHKYVVSGANFLDVSVLKDILSDDTIPDNTPYEYAHVWYTGDRVTQQRSNYAIALALSSRRSFTYESINDQNKTGWYIGDGSTYLYTDYDSERFDGKNFIHKNIDVAYHFPGTTEDEQERVERSIANGYAWRNPTDFSGGVQFKSKFFTAGMEFIAMHYEGEDNVEDKGYGGGLAPHKNDLRAKKAYFAFDDEIVCLGAGITSTMNSPVNTTVDHGRIVREGELSHYVDGEMLPSEEFTSEYEDPKYFLTEGHAGFVILDGKRCLARRYVCESAEGQSFMEYRICHGKNPTDSTYAYVILPYITLEGVEEYAKSPDVEIISNTATLQAVRDKSSGILGIVFHEAGSCEGVAVSEPCFVMLDGEELRVSEPSGKKNTLVITLDGEYGVEMPDEKTTVSVCNGKTVITINIEGANGKPHGVKFKK